jgi:acetate kinase
VSDSSYFRGKARRGGILVLDADTATVDFSLFAVGDDRALVRTVDGRLEQLYADARFRAEDATGRTVTDVDCADENPPGHRVAVEFLLNWLEQRAGAVPVLAVGHRVVHGGPRFSGPARIDALTLRYLQALVPLAPARQRFCLLPIEVIAERWPELPQAACFETTFYHNVPAAGHTVPRSIGKRGMRRYACDGLSFECVLDALPAVDQRASRGKTIVVHVGDRASLCALDGGRGVAVVTGLPGTRARRPDPDEVRHLMAALRLGSDQVRALLRQQSELLADGLAGRLDRLVRSNEPGARIAVELLLYRISRELGSLAAALSGLDAIVFTAAGRPHSVPVRAEICRRAAGLGIDLDPAANQAGGPRLTRPESRVAAWAIPIDKRLLVARRTREVIPLS